MSNLQLTAETIVALFFTGVVLRFVVRWWLNYTEPKTEWAVFFDATLLEPHHEVTLKRDVCFRFRGEHLIIPSHVSAKVRVLSFIVAGRELIRGGPGLPVRIFDEQSNVRFDLAWMKPGQTVTMTVRNEEAKPVLFSAALLGTKMISTSNSALPTTEKTR